MTHNPRKESVAADYIPMTPDPQPQWTDEEVMKEIEDAFDRGLAAAEETIDMKKHDTAIRNAVLDTIIEFTKGNSETIEADDGSLEDAVFLGELLAKIESLRGAP